MKADDDKCDLGNGLYTIKEVSEKLDLSQHTLRYYEKEGLIRNVKRKENGRRIYDDKSVLSIQVVQWLRNSGVSISRIKQYVILSAQGEKTIPRRCELAMERKQIIENQIEEYQQLLHVIEDELKHFQRHMGNSSAL